MSTTDFRTYPWAFRHSDGTVLYKNLHSYSFGYTEYSKKVAAGTSTAVLAATAAGTSVVTVTSGITQPDVPRALIVTPGGTTGNILDSAVTVNGYNIEGKPISEIFRFAAGASAATSGVKAFKTVTSVVIGQQGGTAATFAVGTLNVLGLNHRLFKGNTTVKVYTAAAAYGALTLQGVPTIVANEQNIENNTVLPATIPNGSLIFTVCYTFDNWSLAPVNDNPEYSTTTSTSSTSSSTSSTTITTSTSISSTSTSSTSTSSTSTSISTSSTSTSTTTLP